MTIQLIQSDSDFLNLKEEWNTLLQDSASHVPFLRHEYLFGWWKTLGGGEWDQGTLTILIERDVNNALIGAAPLFIVDHQVMFLGSVEISDYLDLISPNENIPSFIEGIFKFLSSGDFPEWHSLILDNIVENSPSIKHLKKVSMDLGFKYSQKVIQPAPYLPLPKTWHEYLDNLEDRYSHEVKRKIRKAEGYFLPVEWYIVSEIEAIATEMEIFLELMANNPDKKEFLTDTMSQHLVSTAKSAFQEGWLQLAFLTIGDLKVAGCLNFDFDGKIWIYNSGINPLFENLSPGWVLLSYLIQWSIQEGKTELDFMRGDEAYKYQFGGINKNVLQLKILR
jgi:hypothetical protein